MRRDEQAGLRGAVQRKASFGKTIKAVAWSFFGVRKSRHYEEDLAQLNPVHLIVAGLLGAALFVLALVLLVRWVVSSGAMV
ncbi:MAG: DUF2970 domain-containing protein [Rubrivivax sp.]|nr:MAG: DUF2970 domain-containing protein [Rubrivivax sp.]